jgi:heme-degrading monooxygenase HmoA
MIDLARAQPGFLGVESARDADGFGITVSYWESEEAIRAWKSHAEHQVAQATGRDVWYEQFEVRIARVERAYGKA